jgi:serine/threonine protein kinase
MNSDSSLVEMLLADRERRWRSGEQMTSEECLERFPGVREDAEAAVSLIYQEYCLRAESGRQPLASEFLARFPEHTDRLRVQFQFRQAILQVARKSLRRAPEGNRPAQLRRVGPYELRRVLNRGQSTSVFEAIDVRRDAKVVVKLFEIGPENRSEFVRKLRDQARAVGKIGHPNLRRIQAVGLWKGEPYLVTDFIEGTSLAEWFQRRRADDDIRRAVTMVSKLAKALAAVHDAGLIHGDIKPAHVLLTTNQEPVLTDAGLADLWRATGIMDDSSYYVVGVGVELAAKGARPYTAPEQNAGAASPASDVYALGVILHRIITGKLPDSNPPAYHRPELDPVLDAIVKKTIAIDAAHRFANGRELADALTAWLKRRAFR